MIDLRGVSVLVTGADGFIGSHLVEALLGAEADVRAFCLYNSNGSLGWLDGLDPDRRSQLDVRLGDIRDGRLVRDAVQGMEIVLHLAALIAIPYSYQAAASFVDTNIVGTLNVLEAVREAGTRRMVHTSTSEVYGTPQSVPIREDHPLRGQSPYSATKIAADMLCESYARSFETPVVTLRPFNTYGPRQSMRAVIPTILGQMLAGAKRVHVGSLEPKRDFTFVTDTVNGFLRISTAPLEPGAVVQLGTGNAVSIGDVFRACRDATGSTAEPVVDEARVRPDRSEVQVLLSDPARAQALLGWTPTIPLEVGLRRTADWLRGRIDPATASLYHR